MMSGGKFNVSQLNPNEIVDKAQTAKSTVQRMQAQHMWDKKVENVMMKLDAYRQKLAEDATLAGKLDQATRAIATGKVLACADISGSMTTTASGDRPNRPDHAVSLAAAFTGCNPELRGLVMTFSESLISIFRLICTVTRFRRFILRVVLTPPKKIRESYQDVPDVRWILWCAQSSGWWLTALTHLR